MSAPNEKGTPSKVESQTDMTVERPSQAASADAEHDIKYDEPKVTERRVSVGVTTDDAYNPLHRLDKVALLDDADDFCNKFGLQEYRDVFQRGALVAQHPKDYLSIPELSAEDRTDLEFEEKHMWRNLSPLLLYSVVLCALGAATQGWDQTGSNGANLSFPQEFGIGRSVDEPGGERDEWLVGLVNASVYISAAFVGCWISDPLNHWLGRRGEIFVTGLILIATPIGSGFTKSWEALMAVRFVMGVGVGAKAATVPMYCAELSPARLRGALTMGWQLWTAFGIFLGFCANAAVKDTGKIAWRLQLGSAMIPAVPLTLGVMFCPESPRWYMKKGLMAKAWYSMRKLRRSDLQAAPDLYYAYAQFSEEQKIVQGRTYISRLVELFTIPRCRRATLAGSVVMIAQQMCGINIMSFYSSTIFKEGGYNDTQALYASIGFGALNFVFALPSVYFIDSFGRRSLLLATFPNMCWTLLAGGLCFLIDKGDDHSMTRTGVVALFIYLFTITYSLGEGPVPFMYCAEIFPLAQREQGMAWCVAFNNFWGAVLSLTFPRLLRAFTPLGAFEFYAGLNLVAFVMIFLWVPETKRLTLEELDSVFSIPTAKFSAYQLKTWLPWWFQRYVKRDKNAYLPPLVHTADVPDEA